MIIHRRSITLPEWEVHSTETLFSNGGAAYLQHGAWDNPYGLHCGSLYGMIRNWLGLVGASYLQVDDPPLFDEIIEIVGDLCFQCTKYVLETSQKFDFGHFWEDICFKKGPLINPKVFKEKVGPYLMPLFDEFSYYIEAKMIKELLAENTIEILPLSMMRGRTFKNSFVILDEAQNAIKKELKMMLTRLGDNSKIVLSGDLGQSDLSDQDAGAFEYAIERLSDLEGVANVELAAQDIVRHHLIGEIDRRL